MIISVITAVLVLATVFGVVAAVIGRQIFHFTGVVDDLSYGADGSSKEKSLYHVQPYVVAGRLLFYILFIFFFMF